MRHWIILLGGLTVWAAHFFVLYGIASILPGSRAAAWLVLIATLAATAAAGVVLRQAIALARGTDALERWSAQIGAIGAAISLLAILWQAAPALLT